MSNPHFVDSLPALGALVPAAWFFWQRYQSLERRLDGFREKLDHLSHTIELSRQATLSNHENQEYLIHANRELIDHRTRRFTDELGRTEGRLDAEIREIKGFLAQSTEFKIRNR
jgi:hypothetical protein